MTVGIVVGRRLATLHDLETIYGLEGMYDLLEIAGVDSENERRANGRQGG